MHLIGLWRASLAAAIARRSARSAPSRTHIGGRVASAVAVALLAVGTTGVARAVGPATSQTAAGIAGWPAGATVQGLACPGTNLCFAAGGSITLREGLIGYTDNGWTSWTVKRFPRWNFNALACPGPAQCYALGGYQHGNTFTAAVQATRDGGKTWQRELLPAGTEPQEIDCPAITTCVAWEYVAPGAAPAKIAALVTTNGGRTWKVSAAIARRPGSSAGRLACPTSRICYIYAGFSSNGGITSILRSSDSGTSWRSLPGSDLPRLSGAPVHALVNMGGIACPSARVCYAAQGDPRCKCEAWGPYGTIFGTQDGGKHWRPLYRAPGRDYPEGTITCPSVSVCYAVGARQEDVPADQIVLSSKDAGRTWTAHRVPAGPLLACPTVTVCYAGYPTTAEYRTTDGGTTWQPLP